VRQFMVAMNLPSISSRGRAFPRRPIDRRFRRRPSSNGRSVPTFHIRLQMIRGQEENMCAGHRDVAAPGRCTRADIAAFGVVGLPSTCSGDLPGRHATWDGPEGSREVLTAIAEDWSIDEMYFVPTAHFQQLQSHCRLICASGARCPPGTAPRARGRAAAPATAATASCRCSVRRGPRSTG
jgi:hypothetical protein